MSVASGSNWIYGTYGPHLEETMKKIETEAAIHLELIVLLLW